MFLGFSWIGKYTNPINIRHGLKKNAGNFRSPLEARTSRNAWSTAECDATTSTRNLSGRNAIQMEETAANTKGTQEKPSRKDAGLRVENAKIVAEGWFADCTCFDPAAWSVGRQGPWSAAITVAQTRVSRSSGFKAWVVFSSVSPPTRSIGYLPFQLVQDFFHQPSSTVSIGVYTLSGPLVVFCHFT